MIERKLFLEGDTVDIVRIPEFGRIPITQGNRKLIDRLKVFDCAHARQNHGIQIFDWSNIKHVSALNYVGVVHIPGLTVEILPKIDKQFIYEDDSKADLAQNNLLYMLSLSRRIPIRERDLAPLRLNKMPLLEAIIGIFLRRLLDELVIGIDHAYRTQEENSLFIKGKILIQEQIKQNLFHKERSYIKYDEYVSDTWLNRIMKATCKRLLQITQTKSVANLIFKAFAYFQSVEDLEIEEYHFDKVQITRSNERYIPLLEFCRIFMMDSSPAPGYGDNKTFSLLFPMDRLFEDFVAEFIYKYSSHFDIKRSTVHKQAAGKAKWLLTRKMSNGKALGMFRLKPDIVINDDTGGTHFILDTKWKYLLSDQEDSKNGISQADIYQLYAYAHRYNCSNNILLFPAVSGVSAKTYCVQGDENKQIRIEFLNMSRDMQKSRNDLKDEFKKIFKTAVFIPSIPLLSITK